jgi:hypothetical protein
VTDTWNIDAFKKSFTTKGRILPLVTRQAVISATEKNAVRDTQHLHPSEICKKDWCHRSSWYKITGVPTAPENMNFTRLNVFAEGNAIHSKWQNWLWQTGTLYGLWNCKDCKHSWYGVSPDVCEDCSSLNIRYRELPLRDNDHRIIGHADGEIRDSKGKALVEIKSVGIGTVRFENPKLFNAYSSKEITFNDVWKEIKRPFASHVRQGSLYMHCRKIDTMIFIYEWKADQQVKEFEIKYQPELIKDVLEGCKTVIEHLETQSTPPRPQWAVNKSCSGCKYCPFKEHCWNAD